jgi:hypothetical protein
MLPGLAAPGRIASGLDVRLTVRCLAGCLAGWMVRIEEMR